MVTNAIYYKNTSAAKRAVFNGGILDSHALNESFVSDLISDEFIMPMAETAQSKELSSSSRESVFDLILPTMPFEQFDISLCDDCATLSSSQFLSSGNSDMKQFALEEVEASGSDGAWNVADAAVVPFCPLDAIEELTFFELGRTEQF
jgi:hypothetical protein